MLSAEIFQDISVEEIRALVKAGENDPAVKSALKNLTSKLKATNEALGEKQAKPDQATQWLGRSGEEPTSVRNDAGGTSVLAPVMEFKHNEQ